MHSNLDSYRQNGSYTLHWAKIKNYQAFERAIERYQNAESVQFYKRDSRIVEKAQVRISYKLNERLNFFIHSDVFKAARTSSLEGQE